MTDQFDSHNAAIYTLSASQCLMAERLLQLLLLPVQELLLQLQRTYAASRLCQS